jgi:hypothetical protein
VIGTGTPLHSLQQPHLAYAFTILLLSQASSPPTFFLDKGSVQAWYVSAQAATVRSNTTSRHQFTSMIGMQCLPRPSFRERHETVLDDTCDNDMRQVVTANPMRQDTTPYPCSKNTRLATPFHELPKRTHRVRQSMYPSLNGNHDLSAAARLAQWQHYHGQYRRHTWLHPAMNQLSWMVGLLSVLCPG